MQFDCLERTGLYIQLDQRFVEILRPQIECIGEKEDFRKRIEKMKDSGNRML